MNFHGLHNQDSNRDCEHIKAFPGLKFTTGVVVVCSRKK